MAQLIERAIARLLPHGPAFSLIGQAKNVNDALAAEIDAVRLFLDNARAESIPGTATETLPEWHSTLGLELDATQTTAQQRARTSSVHTAIGGQSLDYLDAQIKKQFPQITIYEIQPGEPVLPFTSEYWVIGDVNTTREYNRLLGIIERLVPAHLVPNYVVRILSALTTARCGIATTGRAITGKIE